MRVEGRGAGLGLQDGREEGLKRPYFYISNMLVFMYLFVFTRKRKAVLCLRLCQGDICGNRSSKSAIGFVTFFCPGLHLCTGEVGRGESSAEGEARPLPRRQAALSAIWRSTISVGQFQALFIFSFLSQKYYTQLQNRTPHFTMFYSGEYLFQG